MSEFSDQNVAGTISKGYGGGGGGGYHDDGYGGRRWNRHLRDNSKDFYIVGGSICSAFVVSITQLHGTSFSPSSLTH